MIRRKTTICLILQDMFRIHHPSSVANTEERISSTIEQMNNNHYNSYKDNKGD